MKTSALRKAEKRKQEEKRNAPKKKRRRRTVTAVTDPKTGDVTKTITKRSGATTTKTYGKGKLRPKKVVKTRGGKRTGMLKKEVEGRGLDKKITKYDRKGKKKYTTTPRKRLKKAGETVKTLGKIGATGVGVAMLPGGAQRALMDAGTLGIKGATTIAGGAMAQEAVSKVKKGVKKLKAGVKKTGKKLRANIVSRVQGTRKKKSKKKSKKK